MDLSDQIYSALEYIRATDLKPHPQNPRQHPKKQIKAIRESIERFGFTQPIVIDEDDFIIIGHGRVSAAALEPVREVPCIRVKDFPEERKVALMLADNSINSQGYFDLMALDEAYQELSSYVDLSRFNLQVENESEDFENISDRVDCENEETGPPVEKKQTVSISVSIPESRLSEVNGKLESIANSRVEALRLILGFA